MHNAFRQFATVPAELSAGKCYKGKAMRTSTK